MSNKWIALITLLCLQILGTLPACAQETQFIFPVGCTLQKDCWTVHYVDVDPAPESARDFTCQAKTYDAHKGTDFALSSAAQMKRGVDVLAAASGKVLRVRDGETDTLKTEQDLQTIRESGKECGNGILINHGEGLQTIYCHLQQDSIVVKPNQSINAGQKIAQIGQSGLAEFPHLHFGVMKDDKVIDPFTGLSNTDGCGKMKKRLWHIGLPITHEPVAIFDGGFRAGPPDFEAIKTGQENPASISIKSAAFTFWAGFYNVESGDKIHMKIIDPDEELFIEQTIDQKKTRDRQFFFVGKKIGKLSLKTGTYRGITTITRESQTLETPSITQTREFQTSIQ